MFNNINNDVTALRVHLNDLKSLFDQAMCEGGTFEEVKKIYMQIKEVECQINVLHRQASTKIIHEWPGGHADERKKTL